MIAKQSRFFGVVRDIDAANAGDPRIDIVDGAARPRESVYAERMTQCLTRLYPDASEALRIAARAQHICRWQVPRASYPLGRDGYNSWRGACRDHHAALISDILRRHDYDGTEIANIVGIIKKEALKANPDSQALENVVGVVFAAYYLAPFVSDHPDYDEAKLLGIIKRTLRKMDATGRAGILALSLPEAHRRLIEAAL